MSGNVGPLACRSSSTTPAPTVATGGSARHATWQRAPSLPIAVRDAGLGAGYAVVHRESGGSRAYPRAIGACPSCPGRARHRRRARPRRLPACRPSTPQATRRAPSPSDCPRDERPAVPTRACGEPPREPAPACGRARRLLRERPRGLSLAARGGRVRDRSSTTGRRRSGCSSRVADRRAQPDPATSRSTSRSSPISPERTFAARRRLPDHDAPLEAVGATPSGSAAYTPARLGSDVVGPLQHKRHQYEAAARAGVSHAEDGLSVRPSGGRVRRG